MIITKQKDFKNLLKSIKNGPVFIIGCSDCATLCHTGGEKEVLFMKNNLEKNNIQITGWVILEPACHLQNGKRILKKYKKDVDKAKKILVLACGNGVQSVSEVIDDIDVIPGTDTIFLGEILHAGDFEKRCIICGDCITDLFDGVCPIARCPKNMLNGPCSGSIDGKCEVYNEVDCIWYIIYNRLREKGQLFRLKDIQKPKDWAKSTEFRRFLKDGLQK